MKKIILITGMSGAGKTTTMQVLDDMGYHCIDRFPVELLNNLYELVLNEDQYDKVCLTSTAFEYPIFLNFFEKKNIEVKTIFLDCSDEQLILRYKFTRRQHPFLAARITDTLEDAIKKERTLFENVISHDIKKIDTTKLTNYALKEILEQYAMIDERLNFSVSFISFGFKYGIPQDADMMFDVRFLPNPYYVEQLRALTGNDLEVYDYVMEQQQSVQTIEKLKEIFDFLLSQYENDGRAHVSIAIGCTGGKHRSVSFVNYFFNYYMKKYHCFKKHRDIDRK